ncbi:MAG: translesion error-prone DNA polymerase V autoproteolytic subunit [Marinifilaceae bacterium]|jgi:DNA polymerase V|nr:translesion error-prone DNA polymerase V autoproteolytic subunit [Marinilabiliaceae bacterium JC040]MCT4599938.1 translesion error-prone DNA polymerase V autoproteolytic subunit [Marinifilaceae bacterium]
MQEGKLEIFEIDDRKQADTPYYDTGIAAGFPSPAEQTDTDSLDLNELVIRHREATFYGRVSGESMIDAGLDDGDIIVIDRSLEPLEGKIAVCNIDDEFTIKRLIYRQGRLILKAENKDYPSIEVNELSNFKVWGIVTHVIKSL